MPSSKIAPDAFFVISGVFLLAAFVFTFRRVRPEITAITLVNASTFGITAVSITINHPVDARQPSVIIGDLLITVGFIYSVNRIWRVVCAPDSR